MSDDLKIHLEDEVVILKGEHKRSHGIVKRIDVKQGVNVYTISLVAPATGPTSSPYLIGTTVELLGEFIHKVPLTQRWIKKIDLKQDEPVQEVTSNQLQTKIEVIEVEEPKKRGRPQKNKSEEVKVMNEEKQSVEQAIKQIKANYTFDEITEITKTLTIEIANYLAKLEELEKEFGFKHKAERKE